MQVEKLVEYTVFCTTVHLCCVYSVATGIGMPAHEQNTDHSQHGFPDDADRDSCSPISTYEDRGI